MKPLLHTFLKVPLSFVYVAALLAVDSSCSSSSAEKKLNMPSLQLPVVTVTTTSATTYQEFPATLEGKVNVEIRPQVDGYLEKTYVDESAHSRSAFV